MTIRIKLLFIFFIALYTPIYANSSDSLYLALNKELDSRTYYTDKKEEKIKNLKDILISGNISVHNKYDINQKIFKEYEKYKVDSAISYAKSNVEIAYLLNDPDKINEAKLYLSSSYSSSGMYIEAKKIIEEVRNCSPEILPLYFDVYSKFYANYAQSNKKYTYLKLNEAYRDSLLKTLDKESIEYRLANAENLLYQHQLKIAEKKLLSIVNELDQNKPEYAIVTYLLGTLYKKNKNIELQKKYYTISAICDIRNAIKDNASLQSLALAYYEEGNIDEAYKLTKFAIDDAVFCNVRFRTIEISEFFSIVNSAYLAKEHDQKSKLKQFLLFSSILTLFLIIAIVYVYKQMKRISRIRKKLSDVNIQLMSLNEEITKANNELNSTNDLLSEANRVKEEYIAHFFSLCSNYITKLEDYRKALNKKASLKKMDELFAILKSNSIIDDEREELYHKFDNIFMNLYPTFIQDFNALLIKEEQIQLKQGETLNTELRIFALIRLGITDSSKIASFLCYSLSTIYNYRTKTRNKAAVTREEFESMVMDIGRKKKSI